MKKITRMFLPLMLVLASNVYADAEPAVTQGAKTYDWQSCVNDKKDACVNDCQNSEDMNCTNNCDGLARDKCKALGISQP